jgi:dihydroxyacetone kinase-like protein
MYECGQAVDGGAGVLFLVKNYTGDVLNFETAVELLHGDGVKVGSPSSMTTWRSRTASTPLAAVVCHDRAVREAGRCRRRGGLRSGALRGAGPPHQQPEPHHRRGHARLHRPGCRQASFTLADNEVEFGVGIHGEPGIERRPFTNLDTLVDDMFNELTDNSPYGRTLRHWDRASGSWQEEHTFIEPFNKGDRVIAWSTASAAPRSPSSTASMAASPPCAKRRASIWCATSSAPTAPLST